MQIRRTFTRTLTAAVALGAISTAALAAGPAECALIGTWAGHAGESMYWLGIHTAGTTTAKGEMQMDWVYVAPSLLQGAASLTGARGVWEQVNKGQYKYTWYAFGQNAAGEPIYAVRVSGVAANADCNTVNIGYTYEVFTVSSWPWPQFYSGTPMYSTSGQASETRLPLTVTTP